MQKEKRTQRKYQAQIIRSLENLYISPLESCNLRCRYCYTTKTRPILSNQQILSFVKRYQKYQTLKSIIFCGGEVFTLSSFPHLVNNLIKKGIFITIITNGTIDQLDKIKNPKNCQLIVSFDGPQKIHDQNRGQGNFQKSLNFVRHAQQLGFHLEIFYLITKDSYPYKDKLDIFGIHKTYLVDRLGSLKTSQVLNLLKNYPTYPSRQFGCSQISLQSNQKVYGCCESFHPLASISTPIPQIVDRYLSSLRCTHLCSDPKFFCGFPKLLKLKDYHQVIKALKK